MYKKYIYEKQIKTEPIDSDTVYICKENVFITKMKLNYRNVSGVVVPIKIKPSEIEILIFMIQSGKVNSGKWFNKKDIAEKKDLNIGTVSNFISTMNKISKIISINLIERRGTDAKGCEFRISPECL